MNQNDNDKVLSVVFYVSRNKDNENVAGFKERKKMFVTSNPVSNEFTNEFTNFLNDGFDGEFSRAYISINGRSSKKTRKELIYWLIDNEDANLVKIQNKICSIAMKKENAVTNRWLFDFDSCDVAKLYDFCNELEKLGFGKWDSIFEIPHEYVLKDWYVVHNTPHGYAIVTSRGFDTREILKDRPYVTLKKDGMLCVDWDRKM
jgi:hypothetical protein